MNGAQHYTASEGHLAQAREHHGTHPEESAWHQKQAGVHAALAQTAATVFDTLGRSEWMAAIFATPEDPDPGRGLT